MSCAKGNVQFGMCVFKTMAVTSVVCINRKSVAKVSSVSAKNVLCFLLIAVPNIVHIFRCCEFVMVL